MKFNTSQTDHTLDLAAALTAANRKQYHQTKNLRPLLYHFRAQAITLGGDTDPIEFASAANTWTTKNAVVKLGAMYRKQMRDNSISIKQLPRYGRELRLSLQTGTDGYDHASGSDGFAGSATLDDDATAGNSLYPRDVADASLFNAYTNTDGTSATYYNSNMLSLISIPETTADGEPETVVVCLTGTSDHDANDLALIPEYLASRRNSHDHSEIDADIPSDDNLLMRIGATANEHFDDIIDAVEETGALRPYDEAGANKLVHQGAIMAAGDYCSGVAPLGLLNLKCNADAKFLLTVTAITEM